VDARPRRIQNYRQADGREPYALWFASIKHLPAGKKVAVRIDRAEDGNLGDHRFLGGGFGELRINFGEGYRVYFGEDDDILVLLLGGTKTTQDRDIATAKVYWSDYNA
jgi:putative addiction module killer protein